MDRGRTHSCGYSRAMAGEEERRRERKRGRGGIVCEVEEVDEVEEVRDEVVRSLLEIV